MQRENSLERFRRLHDIKEQCLNNKTSYFLKNHESSTTITINRTEEEIQGVLILNDADGPDSAFLYVSIDSDFQVGDYFTWKTTTFFAYEKVEIVKNVDFIKYKILQCNVYVNDSFWAYFLGPLRKITDVNLTNNTEFSKMVPTLIAPVNDQLIEGQRIIFNNQRWNIEDSDIYSIQGIGYYSLTRSFNNLEETDLEELESFNYINEKITLNTEEGYFESNVPIKILERNIQSITIQFIKKGTHTINILKDGQLLTKTFIVKEHING